MSTKQGVRFPSRPTRFFFLGKELTPKILSKLTMVTVVGSEWESEYRANSLPPSEEADQITWSEITLEEESKPPPSDIAGENEIILLLGVQGEKYYVSVHDTLSNTVKQKGPWSPPKAVKQSSFSFWPKNDPPQYTSYGWFSTLTVGDVVKDTQEFTKTKTEEDDR